MIQKLIAFFTPKPKYITLTSWEHTFGVLWRRNGNYILTWNRLESMKRTKDLTIDKKTGIITINKTKWEKLIK